MRAAIGLLWAGVACQLVVNVSDYQFDGRDAATVVSEIEPPPVSGGLGEPLGPEPGLPRPQTERSLDASSNDAPGAIEDARAEPGLEPELTPDAGPGLPPDPVPEPTPDPVPEPTPDPAPAPPPPDPTYACSLIEYCYAYQVEDTTDEERCRQVGCSLDDAIAECRAEIAEVCGIAPQPPFVMVTLSGERLILN